MNQPSRMSPSYYARPTPQAGGGYDADQHYYNEDNPASPYGLADEPAYVRQAPSGPAKKVRTTLGRAQRDRPRPVIAVDPNARMASAFRPGLVPAAQVRVLDEQEFVPPVRPRRAASMAYLRPLLAREPALYRLTFSGLAWLTAALFLLGLLHFHAAAGSESAQMLAGKLFAKNQSFTYVPADPFQFVGDGWYETGRLIITASGAPVQELAPVRPIGLPLIYAACFWLAPSETLSVAWAHFVNPVAAAMAVLGTFFLARFAGGSFLGMLAMLAMASGQALLELGHDPAGHSVSLALVTWGMFLLLKWWRGGDLLPGLLAGLLLGYAFTISYLNAVMGVPLILACVFAWHWRRPFASTVEVMVPILAWWLPVAGLLYYNRRTTGTWTAHHAVADLAAIDADNILHNWPALLAQLNDAGVYFLLPLGLMGLLALCARRLPLGLTMLCWLALPLLAFAAYAWATFGTAYRPVLLLVTPVVLFGAAYVLRRVLYAPSDAAPQLVEGEDPYTGEPVYMLADPPTPLWRSIAAPVAAGLIVAAAVAIGASRASGEGSAMPAEHQRLANLAALGDFLRVNVPSDAVIFVEPPAGSYGTLEHLSLSADLVLYDAQAFTTRFARRMAEPWSPLADDGGPNPIRQGRHVFLAEQYAALPEGGLSLQVQQTIDRSLEEGREAYLLMNGIAARRFEQAHLLRGFETRTVASFHEWPPIVREEDSIAPTGAEWSLVRITREPQVTVPGTVAATDLGEVVRR